jgi:hypothetical protein
MPRMYRHTVRYCKRYLLEEPLSTRTEYQDADIPRSVSMSFYPKHSRAPKSVNPYQRSHRTLSCCTKYLFQKMAPKEFSDWKTTFVVAIEEKRSSWSELSVVQFTLDSRPANQIQPLKPTNQHRIHHSHGRIR